MRRLPWMLAFPLLAVGQRAPQQPGVSFIRRCEPDLYDVRVCRLELSRLDSRTARLQAVAVRL